MSAPDLKPGATYKFTVRSADEAVRAIREQLGENAKVLSVRQVGGSGLFGRPKLEVVAQISAPAETPAASLPAMSSADSTDASSTLFRSDEPALPAGLADKPADSASQERSARTVPSSAARLPDLLRRSGFSETMVARLQASPALAGQGDRPLHQVLAEVGRALRQHVSKRPIRPLPPRSAFLGTPGVGRTTALCKWLARDVFAQGRAGRVVKAEFDRPNPAEGLAVFCEALGLALEYHAPASEEETPVQGASLAPEPAGGFLYADLPGLSLRHPAENAAIARFLDREQFAGRVLVLNAAYDTAMLRRGYAAGRDLGATHLVFTHLDEVDHWGKLWDFLLEGELTPLFLATGPSLTGDLDEDVVAAALRRTLPGS